MISMGRQIKAARALLGWTREDLAQACEIHPNTVSYWEARARIRVDIYRPYVCELISAALREHGVEVFRSLRPGFGCYV